MLHPAATPKRRIFNFVPLPRDLTSRVVIRSGGRAVQLLVPLLVGAAAAEDIVIQSEQETVIRTYVKKQPLASVKVPGVELNIGTALPDTFELHEIPDVKYRYTVIDNRTVVVDPGTHKIIKVYD
jgi:hypothetical protein